MIKPDEIIRSNRKTLSLSIDFFGRVIVRAPKRFSEERIFAFIREKEDWILRKKAQMEGAGVRLPPENLDGYKLLLLGNFCKISLIDEKFVRYDKENSRLYLPKSGATDRLKKWLKENAKRILSSVTEQTANRTERQRCIAQRFLRFLMKETLNYLLLRLLLCQA